jgi:hypothetical protein
MGTKASHASEGFTTDLFTEVPGRTILGRSLQTTEVAAWYTGTADAMNGAVVGILGIVMGVLLIVLRKPFAREAMNQQNAFWGFRFGEREIKISERVAVLVGICSISFGVWGLLDAFGVKPF